jgi:transposase
MISLPPSVRIYLCADIVDGRMGIDALSGMVSSTLSLDPLSGHLFVFLAARRRCARILFWDHNGFVLYSKRLERGRFQCDGEGLFSTVQTSSGLSLVLVHCWMHARRYFDRAVKAKDLRAAVAMQLIGQMYEVERAATESNVSAEERARRRQSETWPLLERLREWVLEIGPKVVPGTPLGKALRYVERRWLSLCVFVLDGRIAIDNGEVERQIRRIAVGRNNWLFTGGDEAGARLATVASLCATCRRLGIDPWAYLRDALLAAGSGMSPRELVAGFTPWAWAKKQTENASAERVAVGA